MNSLYVRLFGKFQAERAGRAMVGLDALKVQELFCLRGTAAVGR